MYTISECQAIIRALPQRFDSHDFIRLGAIAYPLSFLTLLRQYHGNFTTIDSQIAKFLLNKKDELQIQRLEDVESETIVGTMSKCASWTKE